MVEIQPRETVILASDFAPLVAWYRDVLGFREVRRFEDGYHYANLENGAGIRLGIASAQELGVVPTDRSQNSVVVQFQVDNRAEFFAHLSESGGTVTAGPSFDPKLKFWFGGFSDPEGNPFWVVDKDCP